MGLQTATNPQTGETAVLVDGAWAKADQTAANPQGQKAYLVGGKWLTDTAAAPAVPAAARPDPKAPTAFEQEAKQILGTSTPELIAANPVARIATSAAMPFMGAAAQFEKPFGGHANQDRIDSLRRMQERGSQALGFDNGSGMAADVAGSLIGPGGASTKLPTVAGLVPRTMQSAELGGLAGLTSGAPDSLEAGGAGAALGAAIPAAGKVLSKAGNVVYHGLIEPWANPAAIKGRAYLEAAGNKYGEIRDLLLKNKEIVPGSMPTAGEAAAPAGRTEFSALQESAGKVKPSEYLARSDQQNAARIESLNTFAGTPAKRSEAAADRSARTTPHYEAGQQQTTTDLTGLSDLVERPSMKAVVRRAEQLALEKDPNAPFEPLKKSGMFRAMSGDDAQTLKLAFDDLIRVHPKSAMDTNELQALKDSRSEYIAWMEKQFPDLGTARKLYKMTSAPINQMDVGTELTNKITPALREDAALRSGVFSNAVRDSASTIKKATGEPRFTDLKDILNSRQLQSVHGVQEDLARSDRHLEMSRRGSQAGPNALDLATANLQREAGGPPPALLHRGMMLANSVIARMEGKVNKKLAAELATEMLNPPTVAESMTAAKTRARRNEVMAARILSMQNPAAAAGAAQLGQQGE